MKKLICLLIGVFMSFLEADGLYEQKLDGVQVIVFSLGKKDAPIDKLIAKNDKQKAIIETVKEQGLQNEHNLMLIRGENFTMLVDTGFESTQEKLKEILAKQNVKFEDITHVFITHAHGDHIGGILDKNGENNFKNARLIIDKNEYDFWLKSENALAKNALLAFGENKEFIDHSKPLISSKLDIRAIAAYGHTPGHNMLSVGGDKGFLFIADLMHVEPAQVLDPAIAIAYDNDKDEAVTVRIKFLKEKLLKSNFEKTSFTGTHLPWTTPKKL